MRSFWSSRKSGEFSSFFVLGFVFWGGGGELGGVGGDGPKGGGALSKRCSQSPDGPPSVESDSVWGIMLSRRYIVKKGHPDECWLTSHLVQG